MMNPTDRAGTVSSEAASERARAEQAMPNEPSARRLSDPGDDRARLQRYDALIGAIQGKARAGGKLSRGGMNAQ